MTIAIIDYNAGNLTSVKAAVEHLGFSCLVTQDPRTVGDCERVIFPGVGYAETCMENLRKFGLDTALRDAYQNQKPMLAICIGMQLLFSRSDESACPDGVECLGILAGRVKKFVFPPGKKIKIPHIGWNEIAPRRDHPLMQNFIPQTEMYFVHSYYVQPENPADVLAQTEYGGDYFTCMVGKNNLVATQFHPEKSGESGLLMLKNFCAWDGKI